MNNNQNLDLSNSLYFSIKNELAPYLNLENLDVIGQICSLIDKFESTQNAYYVDSIVVLLKKHNLPFTPTIESCICNAALLRIEQRDRGGIKEIKRENFKAIALELMFKLIFFLDLTKQDASERAAYYIFSNFKDSKIKATSLYKSFNTFSNSTTLNDLSKLPKNDISELIALWKNQLELQYPQPPDGHWVLGE